VTFTSPTHGVIDARRPHPADNAALLEGISTIVVQAPSRAEPGCFDLFETGSIGGVNFIVSAVENAGSYTLTLNRPITPGRVTNICYTDNNGASSVGQFTFHPANVNGDSFANTTDVIALVTILSGVPSPPGVFGSDTDRSGARTPLDLLTLMDLLNGASQFNPWLNTSKPTAPATCP
jgi:hypothetical protein